MGKRVAVDSPPDQLDVVAATPAGEILWRRRFAANAAGEKELLQLLGPEDVVVLEATHGAHHLANRRDASGAAVRITSAELSPTVLCLSGIPLKFSQA
jgi:hypothetical protein